MRLPIVIALDLIVRDVDGGDLEAVLQLLDLRAHLHAHASRPGWRAASSKRNTRPRGRWRGRAPPAAAARRTCPWGRRSISFAPSRGFLARSFTQPIDLALRRTADLQAELEILPYGHVRVERVALEHHGDVRSWRDLVPTRPPMENGARGDLLEPATMRSKVLLRSRRGRPAPRTRAHGSPDRCR